MVEFSDLFDCEVDEFQKKAKPEEEINKMSTKEDLTELQRASQLLRKGYEVQKLSVINNLHRYMKEGGANEELLSLILSSLDDWDDKMQIECARGFVPALDKNLINDTNRQRILKLTIDITTNDVIENQILIQAWMDVFDHVIGKVDFEFIDEVAIKPIFELCERKNPIPKRKKGHRLLMCLVHRCGETAFNEDKMILNKIIGVCSDTNYEIRVDGAIFLRDYLTNNAAVLRLPPPQGSGRLASIYIPELVELLHDEEMLVRLESIEAGVEIIDSMETEILEKDYIPCLIKMLTTQQQNEEVVTRMSKMIGRIAFKLLGIPCAPSSVKGAPVMIPATHTKLREHLISYFQFICEHENDVIRYNAAYNLPCFHMLFRKSDTQPVAGQQLQIPGSASSKQTSNSKDKPATANTQSTRETHDMASHGEDNIQISQFPSNSSHMTNLDYDLDCVDESLSFNFHEAYCTFAQDSNDDIRMLAATTLHEGFLKCGDLQDNSILRDTLNVLLQDENTDVMSALTHQLDTMILRYINKQAVEALLPGQIDLSSRGGATGSGLDSTQAQFNGHGNTPQHNPNAKSNMDLASRGVFPGKAMNLVANNLKQLFYKKQISVGLPEFDRLQEEDTGEHDHGQYLILPEYQTEQLYSSLLDKLLAFKQMLQEKLALWREHVRFIEKLTEVLDLFHPPELHDKLLPSLFEDIQKGNTQMRMACAQLIVKLLANQQDSQRRVALSEQVRQSLARSTAFQIRKTFVFICRLAVGNMSLVYFEENFFDTFLNMSKDKVPQVRMEFARSLIQIKPYLEPSKNRSMELSERMEKLKNDKDRDVADATENVDYDLLLSRKKVLKELSEKEDRCNSRQKRLDAREVKEVEERKRRMEDEEENKYDYLPYSQTNRIGLGVKTKGKKGFKSTGATGLKSTAKNSAGQSTVGSGLIDKNAPKKKNTVSKRNSGSGAGNDLLPGSGSGVSAGQKDLASAGVRKTSMQLPTSSSGLADQKGSSQIQIPGWTQNMHAIGTAALQNAQGGSGSKDYNRNEFGADNYKRYSQISTSSAIKPDYKRSQSLLNNSSAAVGGVVSRLRNKTGKVIGEAGSQIMASGYSQRQQQKNGYQKMKNATGTGGGLMSSSDSSSDSDNDHTPNSAGVHKHKTTF